MGLLTNTVICFAFVPALTPATELSFDEIPAPRAVETSATDSLSVAALAPTMWSLKQEDRHVSDLTEYLLRKVATYSSFEDEWDGPSSVAPTAASSDAAVRFVHLLPGGLPVPGIMVSASGEIGFYWDLDGGYADISFSDQGEGSLFVRSGMGDESFVDGISIGAIDRRWFFEHIGEIATPVARAA